MKNKYKILGIAIILLVLLSYVVYKRQVSPGKYDNFAKCLSENQAAMYGTEWCPHCKSQKALFEKSFKYVDYIDCDYDKDICLLNGVKGYPTWIIKNQSYPGTQSLEILSKLSNCTL